MTTSASPYICIDDIMQPKKSSMGPGRRDARSFRTTLCCFYAPTAFDAMDSTTVQQQGCRIENERAAQSDNASVTDHLRNMSDS